MPATALVEGESDSAAVSAGQLLNELQTQVHSVRNLLASPSFWTDKLTVELAAMRAHAPQEARELVVQTDKGLAALRGVGALRFLLVGTAGGMDVQLQFHEFNAFRLARHVMAASKVKALEMVAQALEMEIPAISSETAAHPEIKSGTYHKAGGGLSFSIDAEQRLFTFEGRSQVMRAAPGGDALRFVIDWPHGWDENQEFALQRDGETLHEIKEGGHSGFLWHLRA